MEFHNFFRHSPCIYVQYVYLYSQPSSGEKEFTLDWSNVEK